MAEFISEEQRLRYIEALLSERAGLLVAGIEDRLHQVEAELARVGHVIEQEAAKPRRATARKAVTKAAEAAETRSTDASS